MAGVHVEVVDGPTAGASASSGADGWFYVPVPSDRDFRVRATKAGYLTVLETYRSYTTEYGGVFLKGYLSLTPTGSPAVFNPGAYSVTLEFPCTGIPADLRTQTFPATVSPIPGVPPGTGFSVAIDGGRFSSQKLVFGVAGPSVGVREEDLWWEVPSFRYFDAIIGLTQTAIVAPLTTSTFSTRATVEYCELNAPKAAARTCSAMPASQVIAAVGCSTGRLTLAPR